MCKAVTSSEIGGVIGKLIRTIDPSNVDRYGFFCYKSKPKTEGFHQKRAWLGSCPARRGTPEAHL